MSDTHRSYHFNSVVVHDMSGLPSDFPCQKLIHRSDEDIAPFRQTLPADSDALCACIQIADAWMQLQLQPPSIHIACNVLHEHLCTWYACFDR